MALQTTRGAFRTAPTYPLQVVTKASGISRGARNITELAQPTLRTKASEGFPDILHRTAGEINEVHGGVTVRPASEYGRVG